MHFSTDFLISNKWIEDLLDVQAIMLIEGWKFKEVINALLEPLLSSCNNTPSSALNILMIVPLIEAVAMRVPSAFTAKAPTSDSCAYIMLSMLLSTTIGKIIIKMSFTLKDIKGKEIVQKTK